MVKLRRKKGWFFSSLVFAADAVLGPKSRDQVCDCPRCLYAVVEHAFSTVATGKQKAELVAEFYAEEFRRFRGVETAGQGK